MLKVRWTDTLRMTPPKIITDTWADDIHFPTLTVNQTLKFALRNKVPDERPEHLDKPHEFVQHVKGGILDSLGIPHTKKTKVGNEFIRGVSGGERKRVSLAEVMATQVSQTWVSSVGQV